MPSVDVATVDWSQNVEEAEISERVIVQLREKQQPRNWVCVTVKVQRRMKTLFLFLFLILFSFRYAFSEQISPLHIGSIFGGGGGGGGSGSSREPKYKIEFHPEDSPFHPDDDQESIVLPDKNGQKFLCYLPKVEKEKSGKPVIQQNISSMIVETEKRVKQKTPDELLEVLKVPCFTRQEGWWSYEFCYQKKLRQLHLEDEKVVQEFVLGVYDPEATAAFNQNLSDISTLKDPRSKDASQRYHAHQYTNGTMCDLTNKPRETEVRFVCSEPRAMISSITEISTCKYALTIQCPTLCKHPLFQAERPVWHTIDCNVLPEDYKDSKVRQENRNTEIVMVTDSEINDSEQ